MVATSTAVLATVPTTQPDKQREDRNGEKDFMHDHRLRRSCLTAAERSLKRRKELPHQIVGTDRHRRLLAPLLGSAARPAVPAAVGDAELDPALRSASRDGRSQCAPVTLSDPLWDRDRRDRAAPISPGSPATEVKFVSVRGPTPRSAVERHVVVVQRVKLDHGYRSRLVCTRRCCRSPRPARSRGFRALRRRGASSSSRRSTCP